MKHKPYKVVRLTEYYKCKYCNEPVKISDQSSNESFGYNDKDGYYHLKCRELVEL